MKKTIAILASLMLLTSFGLVAQTPDEPQEKTAEEVTQSLENQAEETARKVEAGVEEAKQEISEAAQETEQAIDEAVEETSEEAEQTFSDDELPKTAGPLGLLAILGLGAAAGAFGLRKLNK